MEPKTLPIPRGFRGNTHAREEDDIRYDTGIGSKEALLGKEL